MTSFLGCSTARSDFKALLQFVPVSPRLHTFAGMAVAGDFVPGPPKRARSNTDFRGRVLVLCQALIDGQDILSHARDAIVFPDALHSIGSERLSNDRSE